MFVDSRSVATVINTELFEQVNGVFQFSSMEAKLVTP